MGCGRRGETWTATLATAGSDASATFMPLSEPLDLAEVGELATSMEIVSQTANLTVRPAWRTSNDGVTWTNPTGIGAYQTGAGWYHVEFTGPGSTAGRLLQLGLQSLNATATTDVARGVVHLTASFRAAPPRRTALEEIDLSGGHAGVVANGFTASITEQASGFHRVQLTGSGAIADGIAEMYVRTYALVGPDGALVDLAAGEHGVLWEVEVDDTNFPSGDDLLVHFGPVQVSGTSLSSPGAVAVATLMGFKSGSSAGTRGTSRSTGSTNSTTTSDTARRMRGLWLPLIDEVGSPGFGQHVVQWLSASNGALTTIENVNTATPDPAKAWGMALALGFDSAHTNAQTMDVRVSARAFKLPDL